ncbi:unnamed protein product [Cyprideis torosa]|uniref:Uncharacterized protein n=1 Tax=Cyprideis torosa TaxID=163714 RepID=A0A7R8WU32_9CRUS|nr:unnamed protein product [Cyprideis torosa]CAG0908810.1 unnamed protein product [Cyprideis torosa]
MNWTDAQKFCQKLVEGGKLLELETQEEIYAATKFFQSLDGGCNIYGYLFFYTGGISYNRGPFFWSSSEAPIDKSNWYSGQPDDLSNIRALTLTCPSKFLWTDFDARAHQPFFCEWDPQRSSSSSAETVPNCPCSDSEGKED